MLKINSNRKFNVDLVIQNNILFDMSCSCSSKSYCVHEAPFLLFLDEYPEILEDYDERSNKKDIFEGHDLETIRDVLDSGKLQRFIKKEFKKNSKFKYDFIMEFADKSLVDEKRYTKKLNRIIRLGKER